MFFVRVAADIFEKKLNYELCFPHRPTAQELTKMTESVYTTAIASMRPEQVPPHTFHVAKIKVYDQDIKKWVDLLGESQLFDRCQLYVFQPENPWHPNVQTDIPPAVPAPAASGSASSHRAIEGRSPTSGALAPYTGGARSNSGAASTRRGGAAPTSSALVIPKVSADASPEEQIRVVFSEFDIKGTRMIDVEDFRQGFRTMGLDFSSATVDDLFERADVNRDNRISYSEFERFGRLYPIMTGCLYFRSKAFWDEEQLAKEIQAEREAVMRAEAGLDQAQHALESAEGEVNAAMAAVQSAESALKDRTARMRDLAMEMDGAKKEKERLLREKKEREKDFHVAKQREADARKDLQDLGREADKLERRAGALANDASVADEKVRQLMKALEEAKRAADRSHQAAEQAAEEAHLAKERERDAAMEADAVARDIPKAEEQVRGAERQVSLVEQSLRELDTMGKELGREADEAARRRDGEERAVAEAKEKVSQRARELDGARQAVDDRENAAKRKEEELAEHRRSRELITQHERGLIEQELRLREQRDSLEERETRLISDATSYLGSMRANLGVGRSYSRDPSAL